VKPLFRVTESDHPDEPIESSSASDVWKKALQKRKNEINGSKNPSVSGPDVSQ
jgi:hypothetical protein